MRGLHRPLRVLQIPLPVYNLGDVPEERKEIPYRERGKRESCRIAAHILDPISSRSLRNNLYRPKEMLLRGLSSRHGR